MQTCTFIFYQQERKLIDELDNLAEQGPSDRFQFTKQRLDSIQTEIELARAADLKERDQRVFIVLQDLKDRQRVSIVRTKTRSGVTRTAG
jgi:hypothetical protein